MNIYRYDERMNICLYDKYKTFNTAFHQSLAYIQVTCLLSYLYLYDLTNYSEFAYIYKAFRLLE